MGLRDMLVSVPVELSSDHGEIMALTTSAECVSECVSYSLIQAKLGWDKSRSQRAIDVLMGEGMCWVDQGHGGEDTYWFPSLSTKL